MIARLRLISSIYIIYVFAVACISVVLEQLSAAIVDDRDLLALRADVSGKQRTLETEDVGVVVEVTSIGILDIVVVVEIAIIDVTNCVFFFYTLLTTAVTRFV